MIYYLFKLIITIIIILSLISALILIRALKKMKTGKKRYKAARNISVISLLLLGLISVRIAYMEYRLSEEKIIEYFYKYNDLYNETADYITANEPFYLSFSGTDESAYYSYDGSYMHGKFIPLTEQVDDADFLLLFKEIYKKCYISDIKISDGEICFTCYGSFTGPTIMFYYSPGYDKSELYPFLQKPIDENWYREWFMGF